MDVPSRARDGAVVLSHNTKTGRSYNLPAVATCPGATDACKSVCYGRRGRMVLNGAIVTQYNWGVVRADPWAILRMPMPEDPDIAIRLYGNGDVASVAHALATFELCRTHADRVFWMYTRSRYQVGRAIARGGLPSNLVVFASVDRDNYRAALRWARRHGLPPAFMVFPGDDIPGVDDAFLRPVQGSDGLARWPYTKVQRAAACQRCRYCWLTSKQVFALWRAGHGVRFLVH